MSRLKIVARFEVTEQTKDDVVKAILKCIKPSREEAGNIYYDLTESVENPNVLMILEEWESQEAIDFHNQTEHFKELMVNVTGKTKLSIDILKPINS